MRIYQRESGSLGKWIFAGVLFIIVMTFTLAEVNGFNYPHQPSNSNGGDQANRGISEQQTADGQANRSVPSDETCPPTAVPEPTTILLLAGGLGVTLLSRNRKKA